MAVQVTYDPGPESGSFHQRTAPPHSGATYPAGTWVTAAPPGDLQALARPYVVAKLLDVVGVYLKPPHARMHCLPGCADRRRGPRLLWEVAEGRGPQSGLAERIINATLQTKLKGQTPGAGIRWRERKQCMQSRHVCRFTPSSSAMAKSLYPWCASNTMRQRLTTCWGAVRADPHLEQLQLLRVGRTPDWSSCSR
jgi:hypothetical protein